MADPKFSEVQLRGIGRSFAGQVALSGLDLTVRAGEFIALLGPSGCGKSTALNCLAGLIPLTDGEILVDDERVDTKPAEERDFGMVFQNYALFPHMSVAKNIAFGLEMRKRPKAEIKERVAQALELVRLSEHGSKLPGQLSGGQQQRVAIARVIAVEPRLVLMDEPLSNLDAKLRLEMRSEIRRLHQELGFTTIYVTHDQEEALSMADRLVVLRQGKVQQIGTPQELYDSPANWHVADFMGYQNLIDLTVDNVAGDQVRASDGDITLTGTAVEPVAVGDEVRVAVRPHDLQFGGADGSPTTIRGTVGVVEYQGKEVVATVQTGKGRTLHVRTEQTPSPKDAVELTVKVERALVYPRELADAELTTQERELEEVRE
ncbi:MAG: ABC transporter ATP-binding protein [Beutenbergiaceae bacterium]